MCLKRFGCSCSRNELNAAFSFLICSIKSSTVSKRLNTFNFLWVSCSKSSLACSNSFAICPSESSRLSASETAMVSPVPPYQLTTSKGGRVRHVHQTQIGQSQRRTELSIDVENPRSQHRFAIGVSQMR